MRWFIGLCPYKSGCPKGRLNPDRNEGCFHYKTIGGVSRLLHCAQDMAHHDIYDFLEIPPYFNVKR